MALREKSKMDLDAQTTVNQQKNKRQELMVCWFPHGRLWAVYLVVFGASESFRVFQEPLMVDTSPSGKAFLFHRQILINLIMDLINRTWNSHRYALNDSINIPLLIPLYPSHHTWCQFALSTRKTCRPHGTSRASDCPSCGTGCGDAVPHLYPHCWNLNETHWGIGTGPQLDSSQLNMLHALQKLGWQMGFIDRNDFVATQISYPYICHSTSVWFFIVFYYSYSLLKPAYQLFQDIMVFCSSHFPEEEADFADGGYMKFYSLEAAEADIGDENVRLSCVAVINWWIYSISIYRWRWLCFWHERGPLNLPVFWWL